MTKETTTPPQPTENSKEKLTRDLQGMAGKSERLLDDVGHSLAGSLSATGQAISEKACSVASVTDGYVRANPWKIVGVAAAVGVVVGSMLRRR